MDKPLISYHLISSRGLTSHETPAAEALVHIRKFVQDRSACLYIEGCPTKIEDLTVETLEKASEIVVSEVTMGG